MCVAEIGEFLTLLYWHGEKRQKAIINASANMEALIIHGSRLHTEKSLTHLDGYPAMYNLSNLELTLIKQALLSPNEL